MQGGRESRSTPLGASPLNLGHGFCKHFPKVGGTDSPVIGIGIDVMPMSGRESVNKSGTAE